MGGSQSREGLEISDSDEYEDEEEESEEYEEAKSSSASKSHFQTPDSARSSETLGTLDEVDARLRSLKLKYSSKRPSPNLKNAIKLYLHVGGNTPRAKWITSEKLTSYTFIRAEPDNPDDDGEEESDDEGTSKDSNICWVFKIGSKVRTPVTSTLQLKMFPEQRRVDFVALGVWAIKFFADEDYRAFVTKFQNCLFENLYGLEATEENRVKIYGKDFMGWAKPEAADDSIWEDAEDSFARSPASLTPLTASQDLREEFEEAANGGIQSLALGALDNSFLVSDLGIQVMKNFSHGIHGKGAFVNYNGGGAHGNTSSFEHSTPKKALLMKAETNMLLMSPMTDGKPHARGLHQLDIETGRIVTDWKFEKDGADITMRDITNDNKGSQLDPSASTFLGLDDNRLCQWDMRDRKGIVQTIVSGDTPVLNWNQGHQFSRGTNFQCFATTGDGSIVVGSLDGKIRLYSRTSMRMAKTAFPGLGSPITHVDVTYDGKWILGTTNTYLILICTVFIDKDGKSKTGFTGRMGNRIAAPRLLKLTPLDSHLAGVNNQFHGGQFSWVTENGKQERHLVASVGKFSIIWNFQQVKNSNHGCYQNREGLKSCYCYKIVPKDESIVDSRFMHDKFAVSDSPEAPLVVATPMKVSSFSISGRR
ncbi:protein CYPRO4-like [Aristolochia californica]|uniref:protein CYPRO4-like n=1 Tax=Aristolochia californica TaxID=171875 RepID=UPI0035E27F8A